MPIEGNIRFGPAEVVSARELAESLTSLVEGGFIMANAMNDATWTQRQTAEGNREDGRA